MMNMQINKMLGWEETTRHMSQNKGRFSSSTVLKLDRKSRIYLPRVFNWELWDRQIGYFMLFQESTILQPSIQGILKLGHPQVTTLGFFSPVYSFVTWMLFFSGCLPFQETSLGVWASPVLSVWSYSLVYICIYLYIYI